ncbi:MAG: hypothetical protein LBP83_02550 [Dysgonamonadaceae bacterium]|jgi:hypothetical protein|nr:hypothetical protein [Dysgonamonadaceae bacterium]
MLQSNQQYLTETSGWRQQVDISCENFRHAVHPFEPGTIPLTIKYKDNDSNYFPDEFSKTEPTFTTEIIVEFTTTQNNETINDAVQLNANNASNGTAQIDWGDGYVENINVQPLTCIPHTYILPGAYQVNIKASQSVHNITFATLYKPQDDYERPNIRQYLTRILKIKSSTLANLEENFELETPNVQSMTGTFYYCGMTQLPGNLLNQIKATTLYWTFRNMRLTSIHNDLFAGPISQHLYNTADLFRGNPLQSYPDALFRYYSQLKGLN